MNRTYLISSDIEEIPLADVVPGRWQPRQGFDPDRLSELANSIQEHGQIDPALVWENPDGRLELVAGERRWRALCALHLAQTYPNQPLEEWVVKVAGMDAEDLLDQLAIVGRLDWAGDVTLLARRVAADDPGELHLLALVDNLDRENLSPIEEAHALQGVLDEHGWSQRQLSRQIGRSQGFVQQRLALLGLAAEVQEAVNTRVFTPTHARAVAQVPEPVQKAVTGWAIDGDSAASTRDLEKVAREVARLLDLQRWEPNGEAVYQPQERNYLALVRWALENADLARSGDLILDLRKRDSWQGGNLLAKRPRTVVNETRDMNDLLGALHLSPVDKTWPRFAQETGRTCEGCVLKEYPRPTEEPWPGITTVHCRRWRKSEVETCPGFIGQEDPLVIPIHWEMIRGAEEAGLDIVEEPFKHLTSPTDLVTAYKAAVDREIRRQEEAKQKARTGHLEKIRAFHRWQKSLPAEALRHPLAHACEKCAFFSQQKDPPCFYGEEPLEERYGDATRPPDFQALVSKSGAMLPRCEMFRYHQLPPLYAHEGTALVNRDQVLTWIDALITYRERGLYYSHGVHGPLCWLDYDRPAGKAMDTKKLLSWLKRNWDEIGGDPVIPTLIDIVIAENFSSNEARRNGTIPLINPATDEEEIYAAVGLDYVTGAEEWPSWKSWPKDWPRPWEPWGQEPAGQHQANTEGERV